MPRPRIGERRLCLDPRRPDCRRWSADTGRRGLVAAMPRRVRRVATFVVWTRSRTFAPLLVFALLLLGLTASRVVRAQQPSASPVSDAGEAAFVCPMHPDYTTDLEGNCPRCGMALVRATPFDPRDYQLDFRTTRSEEQTSELQSP